MSLSGASFEYGDDTEPDGNPAMAERMLSLIRASDAGDRGIATA